MLTARPRWALNPLLAVASVAFFFGLLEVTLRLAGWPAAGGGDHRWKVADLVPLVDDGNVPDGESPP